MVTIPVVLTIVITFLSPFAVAILNRVRWSSETKNLIGISVSAVIAVVYFIMTGGVDWGNLAIAIPAVYGLQQAVYNFILKTLANRIEAATDPQSKVAVIDKTGQLHSEVTVADHITLVEPEAVHEPAPIVNPEPPVGPVVKG